MPHDGSEMTTLCNDRIQNVEEVLSGLCVFIEKWIFTCCLEMMSVVILQISKSCD